ncbi:MAG: Maf family protein [Firmicutes bacterium]|nr:Maf family protein [Bacillota bacterium]
MKNLILASSSPRRREILGQLGLDFDILPCGADETLEDGISPCTAVKILSARKADAAISHLMPDGEPHVILAADTVVSADGEIFGKPKDEMDAERMLRTLSGRVHEVITGVTVTSVGSDGGVITKETSAVMCRVSMREMTADEICAYIKTKEPLDKAGAYGIQGMGGAFVSRVEGDYFAVVGLPKCESARLLSNAEIDVFTNISAK